MAESDEHLSEALENTGVHSVHFSRRHISLKPSKEALKGKNNFGGLDLFQTDKISTYLGHKGLN